MVKVREKCWNQECKGNADIFPLYMRGYDNKFKRAERKFINERKGTEKIRYGYICSMCNKIIWRDKR